MSAKVPELFRLIFFVGFVLLKRSLISFSCFVQDLAALKCCQPADLQPLKIYSQRIFSDVELRFSIMESKNWAN